MKKNPEFKMALVFWMICFSFFMAGAESLKAAEWEFHVAPYLWTAGQNGSVSLPGVSGPVDIDLDFWDDILEDLNGALMVIGEARKGRYGFAADVMFVRVETEEETPRNLWSSINSTTKSTVLSAFVQYRWIEKEKSFVDLMAGARYWDVDVELKLTENFVQEISASDRESWIDPLVGIRGCMFFGESKWFGSAFFLVGGFDVGSKLMWDLNVNLGYQFNSTFALTAGYRILDVDYEDADYVYDIQQDGPLIGFSFRF
jgi:hypothetical protein